VGKESKLEVSEGREKGVRGEIGDGQGEHLVACTIVSGCTSIASTAAGSQDEHIVTKLLLTPAMSADILIPVKVTHITCCGTYSFCKAILSLVLASRSGGGVHCLLLYTV
jgi:hypothetical protein